MDTLQRLAAETALRKMVAQGYFSICTIDKINEISGKIPDWRAHQILSLLHCIHFKDMLPELQQQLPELIRLALNGAEIDISSVLEARGDKVVAIQPAIKEPEKPAGMRLLGRWGNR